MIGSSLRISQFAAVWVRQSYENGREKQASRRFLFPAVLVLLRNQCAASFGLPESPHFGTKYSGLYLCEQSEESKNVRQGHFLLCKHKRKHTRKRYLCLSPLPSPKGEHPNSKLLLCRRGLLVKMVILKISLFLILLEIEGAWEEVLFFSFLFLQKDVFLHILLFEWIKVYFFLCHFLS